MNVVQQHETPCVPSDPASKFEARSQIRTDEHPVFKPGAITDPKDSWVVHALKALGLNNVFSLGQAGVLAALVFVASLILRAHDMDGMTKIVGVSIVVLTLAILGMANLLVGSRNNATSSQDKADQSAHSGTGGGSA